MIKEVWAKVSYWWFIAMLAIVGFFCGAFNVDALTTITPSRSNHNVFYDVGRCSIGTFPNCDVILEDFRESGWLSGNSYTNFCPSGKVCTIVRDYYYAKFNTSLSPGLSYTLNFNTWLSDRESEAFYRNVTYQMLASNTGEYNGSSSSFIQSFSCRAGIEEGTTSKVSWSCSFVPSAQINYIYLRMFFPSASVKFYSYGINTGSVLYDNAQIDAINNQTNIIIDQTNNIDNSINNINDTLTDDSVDNPNQSIQDMQDMLPTNGTITQLIALPISLYQKVLNSINGTCSQFNLGNLYGINLIMPCIEISNYLGSTLWNTIDIILSGVFVLTIARKMIKAFNSFTFMKEGDVIND